MPAKTFTIEPHGAFSFTASAEFLRGFRPTADSASISGGHLHLAFVPDGEHEAVAVCLREVKGALSGEIVGGADVDTVRAQVARIFSLDIDATDYPMIGARDPIIGRVQQRYPGLRPVLFYSPYEAAVWAIISQRVQSVQAGKIKRRMAEQLGEVVEIHGDRLHAFPGPDGLLMLEDFRGLFGRKAEYLRDIAQAALEGRLDAAALRALPESEAVAALRRLPGIGEFSSGLVLHRGVGFPNATPQREPRFLQALSLAYGVPADLPLQEIGAIAEDWRPFRSWVVFLLRRMLADEERP